MFLPNLPNQNQGPQSSYFETEPNTYVVGIEKALDATHYLAAIHRPPQTPSLRTNMQTPTNAFPSDQLSHGHFFTIFFPRRTFAGAPPTGGGAPPTGGGAPFAWV